jgi:hypothetical protein
MRLTLYLVGTCPIGFNLITLTNDYSITDHIKGISPIIVNVNLIFELVILLI